MNNLKKLKRVIILFLLSLIFIFIVDMFGKLYITADKTQNLNPLHWDDFVEGIPNMLPRLIISSICFTWILTKTDEIK